MMEALGQTFAFWLVLKAILFGMDVRDEMRRRQWLRKKS